MDTANSLDIAVVGAGAMGLAAAYHAAKAGHRVTVYEAAPEIGGMAAHFDLAGLSIERFYHFICKTDQPTFDLLKELGIANTLRWRTTSMGVFSGGKLHDWGNPVALLRYPGVSFISRLRYALLAFASVKRRRWDALETQTAKEWITRWSGREVYEKLWRPLFDLKFHRYADNISAQWIWTRVRRTGLSRKSIFQEELGYLEGGSDTLVRALVRAIKENGGSIRTGDGVEEVVAEDGRTIGVRTPTGFHPADRIISTMPVQYVSDVIPALPAEWKAKYDAIDNIGVCCLVFRLKKSVTSHFWVNIVDDAIDVPGIIEFSNLRVLPDTVVYVPYYMPIDHPRFGWTDEQLIAEALGYLKRVNPALRDDDVIASHVARLRFAQPICEPGFAAKIPPIETPIDGLQVADTCFYYPEDRGISEGVRLAQEMAARLSLSQGKSSSD